jgi:hypothetical protein
LEALEGRDLPSTLTVTNLNDSGPGSLRGQVAAAQSGDTINFASGLHGTITLTSGEILLSKTLTISAPGPGLLTVSGNEASRVFEVSVNQTVSISGLIIAWGWAYNTRIDGSGVVYGEGGAVYVNAGANLAMTNCAVQNSLADALSDFRTVRGFGGGIFSAGTLRLVSCTLDRNDAGSSSAFFGQACAGGGLYISSGSATVTGCTFSGNSAASGGQAGGGAIFINSGALSVTGSTFSGNSASASGGGAYASGGALDNGSGVPNPAGSFSVLSSTFTGNTATAPDGSSHAQGGAVFNSASNNPGLTSCTFSGNVTSAGGSGNSLGGAIFNNGNLTTASSTFSDNSATLTGSSGFAEGGALYSSIGGLGVTDCTLWHNSAVGPYASDQPYGGGINVASGSLVATFCTLAGNNVTASATSTPSAGGGVFAAPGNTLVDTIVAGNTLTNPAGTGPSDVYVGSGTLNQTSSAYNLIGIGGSGGLTNGTNGNRVGVGNASLGSIGSHGGPTTTIPLLAGSPALNTGSAVSFYPADQRGVIRAGGINIGAYQATPSSFAFPGLALVGSVGTSLPFTLAAQDSLGQPAVGYTGTVQFSSTDSRANLPGNSTFTLADGGQRAFSATFHTPGAQTLRASDTVHAARPGRPRPTSPAPPRPGSPRPAPPSMASRSP